MRFHAGALRTAAIVAAVFVATRVIYRIIFGGAAGGGAVLLDLPRIPLGGPFAHVTLFGPITTGGLANSASSALPFAAVILAFGVLNAIIDVQRLFVRGSTRGPLRAISRSLVIAWSTAPALAHAVRRVRQAAALRGERGAAALLVPVFEQTIERALGLAASMEVRGFASSHPAPPPTRAHGEVVVMTNAGLQHNQVPILAGVTLHINAGTLTVLTGPTGSGKSSLLRSLDGLFQHFDGGEQLGSIRICGIDRATTPPRDTAAIVGSVAQNVRLGFATSTVREEIGFSLSASGRAAPLIAERVRETAEQLHINQLLDRSIDALSTGEATLVAIASALAARPALLLVDEPLAELDTAARATVCEALNVLAHELNVAVVVAEHQYAQWAPVADQWLTLRNGHALLSAEPPAAALNALPAAKAATANEPRGVADNREVAATTQAQRHPVAELRALSVAHGGTTVVHDASLKLSAGEIVALTGPNGAGKSSLLMAMARADAAGHMFVNNDDVAGLSAGVRRQHVALVPEQVDELFFQTTVAAECHRADRIDKPARATADSFATLLGITSDTQLAALLTTHPRDLSAGQQLCLAIAIQLAPSPSLLLVDEPSRGLDPRSSHMLGNALLHAAADRTRSVLFATHDSDFAHRFAQRSLVLTRAGLSEAPLAEVPR